MLNLQINGGLLSSPAPWLDGSTNYGEWLRVSSCQLETEVCRLEGAARFILGLYDDIELLGGEELRGYVGYRVRMMRG